MSRELSPVHQAEFEADCLAARERASALIAERHGVDRARVLQWMMREIPRYSLIPKLLKPAIPPVVRVPSSPPKPRKTPVRGLRTANGRTMTLGEWAAHLGISPNSLHQRIFRSGSLEAAIALGGPRRPGGRELQPGVVKNLPILPGTGGGSAAQDLPQLEFSH